VIRLQVCAARRASGVSRGAASPYDRGVFTVRDQEARALPDFFSLPFGLESPARGRAGVVGFNGFKFFLTHCRHGPLYAGHPRLCGTDRQKTKTCMTRTSRVMTAMGDAERRSGGTRA
ncbi:MAG: hypothetical protein WD034_07535, partial [Parvibaculum sp.]